MQQKIIRVREDALIPELDTHTETWTIVRLLGEAPRQEGQDEWVHWVYALIERDEEASAEKLARHENYLSAVNRAFGG